MLGLVRGDKDGLIIYDVPLLNQVAKHAGMLDEYAMQRLNAVIQTDRGHLILKVKNRHDFVVGVKISPTARLQNLMEAYCAHQELSIIE
jgi:hypothetical protein